MPARLLCVCNHTAPQRRSRDARTSSVTPSECAACYNGRDEFKHKTFADCWNNNPVEHTFPSTKNMEFGAFKCCMVSILGASGQHLQDIKNKIRKYKADMPARDVITAVLLGFTLSKRVFSFRENEKVTVVHDRYRSGINNQTGVVVAWSKQYAQTKKVLMDHVTEGEIRLFKQDTHVQIDWPEHINHQQRCIVLEDGDLHGWCTVCLQTNARGSDDNKFRVPTMHLHRIGDSCGRQEDPDWSRRATLSILPGNLSLVPDVLNDTDAVAKAVKLFDPQNTFTPKIFDRFYKTMTEWEDKEQKDALIDTIVHANQHERHMLLDETLNVSDVVRISWECHGTQSVFKGKIPDDSAFVECLVTPGRLGYGTWYQRLKHTRQWDVVWEDGVVEVVSFQKASMIDDTAHHIVAKSRVVPRYNSFNTGTVAWVNHGNDTCGVAFDCAPMIIRVMQLESMQRLFLTKAVECNGATGYLHAAKKNLADSEQQNYTILNFSKKSNVKHFYGQVWVAKQKLTEDNLKHKLVQYMHHPTRRVLFTVQERVGVSIKSIAEAGTNIQISSPEECEAFFHAIAVFCTGAANMHRMGWTHNDGHTGNMTLSGPAMDGRFVVKLIDFDLMKEHGNDAMRQKRDFSRIIVSLQRMLTLVTYDDHDTTTDQQFTYCDHHAPRKLEDMNTDDTTSASFVGDTVVGFEKLGRFFDGLYAHAVLQTQATAAPAAQSLSHAPQPPVPGLGESTLRYS